jgi:hypothetical protein
MDRNQDPAQPMRRMPRLAHLVNVFVPQQGSEFEYVQPITLASMQRAQAHAAEAGIDVQLLTAQFSGDHAAVPPGWQATEDLSQSVRDVYHDASLPPLPLFAHLLGRLYAATDAEYLIYTNIDIALQPHFYVAVAAFIAEGHDAMIINRRRIGGHFRAVAELPAMYAERGLPHPGFDCFVFHRDLYPRFELDQVCIGIPFIEILMGQNLFCLARNFKLYEHEYLTFHIGEEVFKPRHPFLLQQNRSAFRRAIKVLWPLLDSRKFPYGDRWILSRIIRWGLHPCIPIRLCLRLEGRRWLR